MYTSMISATVFIIFYNIKYFHCSFDTFYKELLYVLAEVVPKFFFFLKT